MSSKDVALAYCFLRIALSLNIMMHGVSRLLSGDSAFAAGLVHTLANTPLPPAVTLAFGLSLPWIEAVVGFLLLIGLFSRTVLMVGSILMILLTFGSSLHQDWSIVSIQLTYSLVYSALLALHSVDNFSLDALFNNRKIRAASRLETDNPGYPKKIF